MIRQASVVKFGRVFACRTCLAQRELSLGDLVDGVREGRAGTLAALTLEADKVLVY